MANLDSKTDGDFRDVRAEVGRLMGKWLGASIDPAVVIAALLSNASALAMMRTFGKRGQARDMVQEMTDAAFDDADKRMRKVHASDRLRLLFDEYRRSLVELVSDVRLAPVRNVTDQAPP